MANMAHKYEARSYRPSNSDWRDDYGPARRSHSSATVLGLPLAGLVAVGLGVLAWYYIGPDVRRYMRIRDM